MTQYINKAAVMAEIDEIVRALQKNCNPNPMGNMQECLAAAQIEAINLIKDFLDTIKVKEVDLEKEMDEWRHNHFHGARDDKGAAGEWLTRKSQLDIAKHFFELGLKAQKGE